MRTNWSAPGPLPPIHSYCSEPPLGHEWLELVDLGGYWGARGATIAAERDRCFGAGRWTMAWHWEGEAIDRAQAMGHYDEAYHRYFAGNANVLEWLVAIGSEVYDNALSNVESGLDYAVQEVPGTHLQDISIRRSLVRLARRFGGDHAIEVRGHKSEGFRLNPGQVPFHRPECVLDGSGVRGRWWGPDSIEAFWQHNKLIGVAPEALVLRPLLRGPEGLWCEGHLGFACLVPRDGGRRIAARGLRSVRALASGVRRADRRHVAIRGASWSSFPEIVARGIDALPDRDERSVSP